MKRLLLLGAGNAQIDAINYCKSHNIHVIGCSYTNTDSGIPLLDDFEQVDIKDIEGVKGLAVKYRADAVYSIGSDLAMPTAMKVSEDLRLPHFISSQTAGICHSKDRMRQALGNDFSGSVSFIVCDRLQDAKYYDKFPAMMKPVDSQGQRGCFRVNSFDDISAHFETSMSYSSSGKVIIEEFIPGAEISVNAYVQNGAMRFAIVSDRFAFDEYPGGIIKKHRVPSLFTDKYSGSAAVKVTEIASSVLGISDGPVYCQLKLDKDGQPKILEIAPRLDGCHMWRLIKYYCGVDLLDACFSHLLCNKQVHTEGDQVNDKPGDTHKKDSWELEFMCEKTGEIFSRSKYDTAGAKFINWYLKDGDIVPKLNGYMEKCGYMIRKI